MTKILPVRYPAGGRELPVFIDDEDLPLVQGYDWKIIALSRTRLYASASKRADNGTSEQILMHRLIAGAPDGLQVDHHNLNGLDNRRTNLRVATQSQNQANTGLNTNNTSGYKGVTKHKRTGRWQAQISKDGNMRYLGLHDTPEAAARAYDAAALEFYGQFARLNFPPGEARDRS